MHVSLEMLLSWITFVIVPVSASPVQPQQVLSAGAFKQVSEDMTNALSVKQYGLPVQQQRYAFANHYNVMIGLGSHPAQLINAVIDLQWADTWVVSIRCDTTQNPACAHHLRYNASASSTYRPDPQDHQLHFAYPMWPELNGTLSHDTLSLNSGIHVPDLPFVELTSWQGFPHEFDAVLGLAPGRGIYFEGSDAPGLPSAFKHMIDANVTKRNLFSLLIPRDEHEFGDLSFGVIHEDLYHGKLIRHPLLPTGAGNESWQIAAPEISLRDSAGKELSSHSLKGFKAQIDSTFGSIALPEAIAEDILTTLNVTEVPGCSFLREVPCGKVQDMPDLVLDFDGQTIAIKPEFYIQDASGFPFCPGRPICMPFILGFDSESLPWIGNDTIILGDAFLKSVYSVYDWDEKTISFAPARHRLL